MLINVTPAKHTPTIGNADTTGWRDSMGNHGSEVLPNDLGNSLTGDSHDNHYDVDDADKRNDSHDCGDLDTIGLVVG